MWCVCVIKSVLCITVLCRKVAINLTFYMTEPQLSVERTLAFL